MAVGPDRVQVLRQESVAGGGNGAQDVPYTSPLSPQEDALESAGLYLQDSGARDENVWIERNGNDMRFRDLNNTTPVTLTSLLGGASATDYAFRRLFSLMGA